ncbi:flagellar basal body rod protein FlgB [Natronospora cellulosivora (SeqCode)]
MFTFLNFLQKGLDGSSQRQRALSNNIANVNTPNYKRKDVDFISVLRNETKQSGRKALKNTNPKHISFKSTNSQFRKIQQANTSARNDGNNVEVDAEMSELAKNNIYYNTLVQQVNDRFKFLNAVIDKGGR